MVMHMAVLIGVLAPVICRLLAFMDEAGSAEALEEQI